LKSFTPTTFCKAAESRFDYFDETGGSNFHTCGGKVWSTVTLSHFRWENGVNGHTFPISMGKWEKLQKIFTIKMAEEKLPKYCIYLIFFDQQLCMNFSSCMFQIVS